MNFCNEFEIELSSGEEYRLEVGENLKIRVKVEIGLAEIKGLELIKDRWYPLSDIRTAIFTFTGCRIKVEGPREVGYISKYSPFSGIFKVFDEIARPQSGKIGCCNTLIIGKGRSTASVTICNYFIRMHKNVRFTEIDPSKGNIFPGTLSSMVVEGLSEHYFELNNPKCLFYGSNDIENGEIYEKQLKSLQGIISKETKLNHIILGPKYESKRLLSIIEIFSVNKIVVIGDERVYGKVIHEVLNYPTKVDSINTVSSTFIYNTGFIPENSSSKSIHRYFNGVEYANPLIPSRIVLNSKNLSIVKVGEEYVAPDSALPLGGDRKVGTMGVAEVDMIENAVLALSEAEDEDDVITSPVSGFIVCIDQKKNKVLSPQPKLPKLKYLVQGQLRYVDY